MKDSSGAVFDDSQKYRYRLWRRWNPALPAVCIVMLNPTATEAAAKDPTIERCAILAEKWGFGGIEIVNLFAFRATRPRDLWQAEDPVGSHNDEHIKRAIAHSKTCVVAWGDLPHGRLDRTKSVLNLLAGHELFCLGMTKLHQPRHPLQLVTFAGEELSIALSTFAAPFQTR